MHDHASKPVTAAPAKEKRPETPFDSLRNEIERVFDKARPACGGPQAPRLVLEVGPSDWPVVPAVDVLERDGEYEISAELPGIAEEDLEIGLLDRTLMIKGVKRPAGEGSGQDHLLSERRYGTFQRSFRLPDAVDAEAIEASFVGGVLTVRLPRIADAPRARRKIEVRTA